VSELLIYFETMAGTHLVDSVRALRDAGSPDALYDPLLCAKDHENIGYDDFSVATDIAHGEHVSYSRRGLLFAAFRQRPMPTTSCTRSGVARIEMHYRSCPRSISTRFYLPSVVK
jgi:hypothetical protein